MVEKVFWQVMKDMTAWQKEETGKDFYKYWWVREGVTYWLTWWMPTLTAGFKGAVNMYFIVPIKWQAVRELLIDSNDSNITWLELTLNLLHPGKFKKEANFVVTLFIDKIIQNLHSPFFFFRTNPFRSIVFFQDSTWNYRNSSSV